MHLSLKLETVHRVDVFIDSIIQCFFIYLCAMSIKHVWHLDSQRLIGKGVELATQQEHYLLI